MIQLAESCLMFHTCTGDNIPYSAESICVELIGDAASMFDPDVVKHAAAAVLHYYRDELQQEAVTVAEFTLALEKVLRGFKLKSGGDDIDDFTPRLAHADLSSLAAEASDAGALFFLPRLRDELKAQLKTSPQILTFKGLRSCVKKLEGARRWTPRCQTTHDQIVDYLRSCLVQEGTGNSCALVVK
jgi:hypothetical protein